MEQNHKCNDTGIQCNKCCHVGVCKFVDDAVNFKDRFANLTTKSLPFVFDVRCEYYTEKK